MVGGRKLWLCGGGRLQRAKNLTRVGTLRPLPRLNDEKVTDTMRALLDHQGGGPFECQARSDHDYVERKEVC